MMTSIGRFFWLEYHRSPVDWWWLACLMGGGLLLAGLGFWRQIRHADATHALGFLHNSYDDVSITIMPNSDPALALFSANQVEAFSIAKGFRDLLRALPPEPEAGGFRADRYGSDFDDQVRGMTAYGVAQGEWSNQLYHAYHATKLPERLTNLTHKLGAARRDVSRLEGYCKAVGSGDNVRAAIDELWRLAKEMEQP